MARVVTETVSSWLREAGRPHFLWGIMLGLLSAGLWITIQYGQWARDDERTQTRLAALTSDLQRIATIQEAMRQRGDGNFTDVRRLLEEVASLRTSRVEDDKATQAQALRDAEFRARVSNQLERQAEQINRLIQQSLQERPPSLMRPSWETWNP